MITLIPDISSNKIESSSGAVTSQVDDGPGCLDISGHGTRGFVNISIHRKGGKEPSFMERKPLSHDVCVREKTDCSSASGETVDDSDSSDSRFHGQRGGLKETSYVKKKPLSHRKGGKATSHVKREPRSRDIRNYKNESSSGSVSSETVDDSDSSDSGFHFQRKSGNTANVKGGGETSYVKRKPLSHIN
mmetsp:Transcript_52796/g.61661  ORF Transcript_52796/g.61661 Transcript_52796/m.61661 type:complete len:189 (+) Transcript_52796:272-838(+)